ncbi:hypothetical protein LINPERHAP1_LOCUS12282, partial [Linum perenne]
MASNKGDALVTAGVLMLMAMLVLQEVRYTKAGTDPIFDKCFNACMKACSDSG